MKSPRKDIPSLLVTAILSSFLITVLAAEYEAYENDITTNPNFGCRWYGGSSSRMSCTCVKNAQMSIEKNSIPSYSVTGIEIFGCETVSFGKNSISDITTLRTINLSGIDSIVFEEESMIWYGYKETGNQYEERFDLSVPSVKISIYNSTISVISSHAFRGRYSEIIFDGVTVEKILPLAFANLLQTERISIRNSELKVLNQPFRKFGTEYLELDGVSADIIPSRTFSNITVYRKVFINNCSFREISSGAFTINNPELVEITSNKIHQLNGEAFKIVSKGTVSFTNNTFNEVADGAFRGITFRQDGVVNNIGLNFESNTFSTLTRYSLSLSGSNFNVRFIDIYINETCDCRDIDHKIKESAYYANIKCVYNGEYMVIKDYKTDMCSIISNHYITIILVCVVFALLFFVICGLLMYYKTVYRNKKYGSKKQNPKTIPSLIVPDGRTYRETELHIIVEKTDLLTTDL